MIDVTFDFTTDSAGYWDKSWERGEGLGGGGADLDIAIKILQHYHKNRKP